MSEFDIFSSPWRSRRTSTKSPKTTLIFVVVLAALLLWLSPANPDGRTRTDEAVLGLRDGLTRTMRARTPRVALAASPARHDGGRS
uniref:Uncharacterized protein n=1 Tax=Oryza sativa subsp. japonica TaxID=39947 RepID=Q5Z6L6_ORYSJ|nr:hypothetical protein [Oryza sativa Japonica Group]